MDLPSRNMGQYKNYQLLIKLVLVFLILRPYIGDSIYSRKDGLYEVRVSQRAEDDILKIVKRGISGIDALGKDEEKLKKKHNITIHDFEDTELTRGY